MWLVGEENRIRIGKKEREKMESLIFRALKILG